MMGWLNRILRRTDDARSQADGLMQCPPLHGPYRRRDAWPLVFASGLGPALALLTVYETHTGAVAIVLPADLDRKVGAPMINFVESLATETKKLAPDVAALVLVWPVDDDNSAVRVSFRNKLDTPTPAGGRTIIVTDQSSHDMIPGSRTTQYANPVWWHYPESEEPFTPQEVPERAYTYAEVDAALASLPEGQQVIDQVLRGKEEAWLGHKALLKEWGLE